MLDARALWRPSLTSCIPKSQSLATCSPSINTLDDWIMRKTKKLLNKQFEELRNRNHNQLGIFLLIIKRTLRSPCTIGCGVRACKYSIPRATS
jgi:hypothetical protein